ncbi:MAG: phospholipase [Chloroflexi bacterium]|nr:phospholipase [Chloroflexota bacterium]
MSHSHLPAEYWTRRHTEPVVLDIGGDVGALVLYTSPALHGHEIEVAPLGSDARRVHSAVLERSIGGRTVYAAVYPELQAGDYEVCCADSTTFTIVGGAVSEVRITS